MRPVGRASRWAWGLCGLVTAAAVAVPVSRLILVAGENPAQAAASARREQSIALLKAAHMVRAPSEMRTITVPQPVTSVNVQDYAGLLVVTEAHVTHVQVTETILFGYHASPPAVVQSVSGGRLSLADPACANWTCSVSFGVTVPPGVTVTAAGGPMSISGTSGANLDSYGEPVTAANIHGPLTVSTHGGPLEINGLTGPLSASTAGGQLVATHVTAATAVVTTGTGRAYIAFSAAPESVTISTAGARARLTVPGGPYALNANSNGAPQIIDIASNSAASHSITVTTRGGPLAITSPEASGTLPAQPSPLSAGTAIVPGTTVTQARRIPDCGPVPAACIVNPRTEFVDLGEQWGQFVVWGQRPVPRECTSNLAGLAAFSNDISDHERGFRYPRGLWLGCTAYVEPRHRPRGSATDPGVVAVLRHLFWMS
jgi:hypothetical protein